MIVGVAGKLLVERVTFGPRRSSKEKHLLAPVTAPREQEVQAPVIIINLLLAVEGRNTEKGTKDYRAISDDVKRRWC